MRIPVTVVHETSAAPSYHALKGEAMNTRARRCQALEFLFAFVVWCGAANAGTLELTTLAESGRPLPCRILIRGSDGRCAIPDDAVTLTTGRDEWFISPGACRVQVPKGDTSIRIEHGPEYARIKQLLNVQNDREARTYRLRRWIEMRQRGYLCGENHLHVAAARLAPMLVAEGMDFGSSLTWWRGPDPLRRIPAGVGRVRELQFAGRKVPTSIYDAELEYSWGAAYIQNLPAPMPLIADPARPNLDYLRHAIAAGAIVHYQGGWSREVLVDALVGCVHTVNICNNNFALHRFQPRSRYSNLLNVKGFPTYPGTEQGMVSMNMDTYYRLLNCGLRLAAGAGSATGVKQAPVGYNRAYVRVPPTASIDEFYLAWKSGKNFVTNGPMLFLRAETKDGPGDTIGLPRGGGMVNLDVEAITDQSLTTVEIVVNGKVVHSLDIDDAKRVKRRLAVLVTRGSWIAARCTALDELLSDDELSRYDDENQNRAFPVAPSRLRFAHTSPIYVTVDDRGAADPESIQEGMQMLKQFEAYTKETAAKRYQASTIEAIELARQRLRTLATAGGVRSGN